jgi:hypothetical protein
MVLSTQERVFPVEYFFQEGNRYTDLVQEQFSAKFPETPAPHRNAFRRLIEKLNKTGSVFDAERNGRPSNLNDKKLLDISDSMLRSPSKSLRKVDITSITLYKQVHSDFPNTLYYSYLSYLEFAHHGLTFHGDFQDRHLC